MAFNATKCQIWHKLRVEYHLPEAEGNIKLDILTEEEKVLRIIFASKLTFSDHCEMPVNSVNRILNLIWVSYTYIESSTIGKLFKVLVKPHMPMWSGYQSSGRMPSPWKESR